MGCVEDTLCNDDFEFIAFYSFFDVDYSFCRSLYFFFGASEKGMIANFTPLYLRVHLDLLSPFLCGDLACFVAFHMKLLHRPAPPFLFREHRKFICALIEVKTCSLLFVGVLIAWWVGSLFDTKYVSEGAEAVLLASK